MPDDARLVIASSAGRAIGTLQRDSKKTYAGIMLDHDLQQQAVTATDNCLSGTDLVNVIIRTTDRDVPILIHSMNSSRAPAMASRLDRAGFWVTQIPSNELTRDRLRQWLDDARDLWSDGE